MARASVPSSGSLDRKRLAPPDALLSWGVVHTVFTLRYARLYCTGTDGGVNLLAAVLSHRYTPS